MKTFMAKARKITIVISWTLIAIVSAFMVLVLTMPDSPEVAAHKAEIAEQQAEADAERNLRQHRVGVVVDTLKASLRAPDSLVIRQANVLEDGTICMTYSAQNGFGGMNVEQIAVTTTGAVDYAEHCNGKSGISETSYAQTHARFN